MNCVHLSNAGLVPAVAVTCVTWKDRIPGVDDQVPEYWGLEAHFIYACIHIHAGKLLRTHNLTRRRMNLQVLTDNQKQTNICVNDYQRHEVVASYSL